MAVGEVTGHGTVLFEARAGMDRTGKWSMAAVVLGCLLAIPYAFARNADSDLSENLLIIGATSVIVLVTVLLTVVHLNARIVVTETHVIKHRLLRRALVIPRAEVVEAVVTREYAVPGARELSAVEALAQAAPVVTHVPVRHPAEARVRWPHMLPWSHANPRAGVLLGAGLVLGFIVLGLLAAVLFA